MTDLNNSIILTIDGVDRLNLDPNVVIKKRLDRYLDSYDGSRISINFDDDLLIVCDNPQITYDRLALFLTKCIKAIHNDYVDNDNSLQSAYTNYHLEMRTDDDWECLIFIRAFLNLDKNTATRNSRIINHLTYYINRSNIFTSTPPNLNLDILIQYPQNNLIANVGLYYNTNNYPIPKNNYNFHCNNYLCKAKPNKHNSLQIDPATKDKLMTNGLINNKNLKKIFIDGVYVLKCCENECVVLDILIHETNNSSLGSKNSTLQITNIKKNEEYDFRLEDMLNAVRHTYHCGGVHDGKTISESSLNVAKPDFRGDPIENRLLYSVSNINLVLMVFKKDMQTGVLEKED